MINMSEKKTIQLRVEDKSKNETVDFLLDSNTIRLRFGASEAREDAIKAVQEFFEYTDNKQDVYNFLVPWQVGSELRIYIYRMRNLHPENLEFQENVNKVEGYITDIEFVDCDSDKFQEEDIRMFFDYLKANYQFLFEDGTKLKLGSLKADDARILLTALQEDQSIVTHNVKDFAPIFAFNKAIWNPVSDEIYRLSPEAEQLFKEDTNIQQWVERIINKFNIDVSSDKENKILNALKENKED